MLHLPRSCRFLLISLLMVSYLQGVMQQPLLEALHLVTHIQGWATGNDHFHSYHSHGSADHQHATLENIAAAQDDQEDESLAVEVKKKIEMIEVEVENIFARSKASSLNFPYVFSFQNPFIPVFVPPPGVA